MITPILTLKNVSYAREKPILKDISWTVKPQEHWLLLGRNGAGKSTLLSLLHGAIWATKGQIAVLGEEFGKTNIVHLRQRIGIVSNGLQRKMPDNYLAQYIVLTGRKASIGIHEDVDPQDYADAIACLKRLGGGHLIDHPYQRLSQGERQLVLIARALFADPALLILDEPCNGLDMVARHDLLQRIERLSQSPNCPTLIFVSHHTDELLPLFQKTLLLKAGAVFDQGNTTDLLQADTLSQFYDCPITRTELTPNKFIAYPE